MADENTPGYKLHDAALSKVDSKSSSVQIRAWISILQGEVVVKVVNLETASKTKVLRVFHRSARHSLYESVAGRRHLKDPEDGPWK